MFNRKTSRTFFTYLDEMHPNCRTSATGSSGMILAFVLAGWVGSLLLNEKMERCYRRKIGVSPSRVSCTFYLCCSCTHRTWILSPNSLFLKPQLSSCSGSFHPDACKIMNQQIGLHEVLMMIVVSIQCGVPCHWHARYTLTFSFVKT